MHARSSSRSSTRHELILFASLCLVWGLTWVPAKVGVDRMSPLLFAAARGLAAGPLLLLVALLRGVSLRLERPSRARLMLVGLTSFTLTYGLLYWGMERVSSGLAAVVNLSMVPISLLALGALMGEERVDAWKLAATALGILGLLLLHVGELGTPATPGAPLDSWRSLPPPSPIRAARSSVGTCCGATRRT